MEVAQISIFLENRTGEISEVAELLAKNGIDIQALSLADMADFGILRVVVDDADRTRAVLKEAGFTADKTRVVALAVPDRPGGVAEALKALARAGIGVEYLYSAARRHGERATFVLRVDEVDKAVAALRGAGVEVLDRLDKI